MVIAVLDDTSYLLLTILKCYGRPMERAVLHRHVYRIAERAGLELDVKFYGKPPFSPQLDRKLEDLVERGVLRRLYLVGPLYTELYREYFKLTEEGEKLLESSPPRGFEEEVRKYFEELEAKGKGGGR